MKKSGYAFLLFAIGLLAVCGQTGNGKFQNPLNPGPDPYCEFFEGNYYLATTQGDDISGGTIDYSGGNGITFQNNMNMPDDGCNIRDNQNISDNGNAAVGTYKAHLGANPGFSNYTCAGNPGGNGVVIFSP